MYEGNVFETFGKVPFPGTAKYGSTQLCTVIELTAEMVVIVEMGIHFEK